MGLGDWVSGLFGSDNQKTFHMDPTKVDPNAYQYGGQAGGAAAAAGQYGKTATDAQGRQGVQLGTGQMDQSRGQQEDALNNLRGAANGTAPSVAQGQMQQGLNSSILAQGSAAASARGPAAMGAAQYGAAANSAAQSQAAVGQAANLRASEMAQARGEYMGAASGIRGQDFQQSATQAQLEAQQRAQNDQMQLGMTGDQIAVNNAQLGAQMQGQAQQSANDLGAQGLNLKAAQGADDQNSSGAMFGVGLASAGLAAASGGASAAVPSDENIKTGIAPEGGALGYGMPGGVGVDRSKMGFGDAQGGAGGMGPYMGLMSMNTQALGYGGGPAAPAPAGSASNPAALAKPMLGQEGSDLAKMIAMSGAGGDGKKNPMGSGMSAGAALGGGISKLFGGGAAAPGAAGGATAAAAPELGELSDARAKEAARTEGVKEGMATVASMFTPNMQPAAHGQQDPAVMMQTNEQSTHRAAPQQVAQAPQHAAPAQMLDALQPVSYNYKPGVGEDPTKRQYGIIAQDLAASPMGASAVQKRPDGLLAVDVPKATTVNLAASANLNQRVRELEKRGGLGISKLTGGR